MTEAEENAIKLRGIQQQAGNEELIAIWKDFARSEKLARLASPAFVALRRKSVTKRDNVQARNLRIHKIAKKISVQRWLEKSNSWIASRLAVDQGRSVNTLRADVAAAKKFLMGSQSPKN